LRDKIIGSVLIFCLFLSGCATYGPTKYTTDVFNDYHAEENGLSIRFGPIVDKKESLGYLKLPPARYDLLPVFITIVNKSEAIKKIDTDASYLTDNSNQVKYESLSVEKTVKMLQSSGWIPATLFGFTGSVITSSIEEGKDDNLYGKAFKPRIINPGKSGEGVFFFRVPKGDILNREFNLYLVVENLSNNSIEKVRIPFKTR